MTVDQLRKLDDERLLTYFTHHAGYSADAPKEPYSIRVGSKFLFSNDTADLRDKFIAYVRRAS